MEQKKPFLWRTVFFVTTMVALWVFLGDRYFFRDTGMLPGPEHK